MNSYLQWLNFPFVRYLLFFLAGIGISKIISLPDHYSCFITLLTVVLFFVGAMLKWQPSRMGLIGLVFFMSVGFSISMLNKDKRLLGSSTHSSKAFTCTLLDYQGFTGQSHKYLLTIRHVLNNGKVKVASGFLLFYSREDLSIKIGDVLLVKKEWTAIKSRNNPFAFDYASYMKQQGIRGMVFGTKEDLIILGSEKASYFTQLSSSIRNYCLKILSSTIDTERERSVAGALLIGQKSDLKGEIKKIYSATGAMHVLAVSGLHVGILFIVFGRVLNRIPMPEVIRQLLIISLIWIFASVTGFSPSVVRASSMFTAYCIGLLLGRKSNIYNTIAIVAFIMILLDMNSLYDVGFQLSFLALTGIVYLQEKIYRVLCFKNVILDKIWELSSVGIAAQIATFPLGLYYFHQFPTYFFLSNLVAIPMAIIIVNTGILLFLLGHFDWVDGLGSLMEQILYLTNEIMKFISLLPGAVISVAHFTLNELVLCYVLMGSIILFIELRKLTWLVIATISAFSLLWQGFIISANDQTPRVIVYSLQNGSCIDFFKNGKYFSLEKNLSEEQIEYSIHPARTVYGSKGLDTKSKNMLSQQVGEHSRLILFEGTTFLVLNEPLVSAEGNRVDYVLSGEKTESHWMDSLEFDTIVLTSAIKPWVEKAIINKYNSKVISTENQAFEAVFP